jgi:hypothetical protein
MKNKTLMALAAVALTLGAVDANAASKPKLTPWTAVISTCGWEEGEENLINTGTSDYQYNNGTNSYSVNSAYYPGSTASKTGTKLKGLSVRCNITNTVGGLSTVKWNTLSVGYQDPDGSKTVSQVLVSVYEIDPETGNATTVDAAGKDVPFATFDSNVDGNGATDDNQAQVKFIHPLDFGKYNYVLVSKLYNTGGDATNPDIWTVRLDRF